jgi:spore germination protein
MQIHVVNVGDTLWKISRFYGVSISSIVQANLVTNPDRLVLGQALVVPTPRGAHIVRSGESIWSISQLYGIPPNVLASDNQIINAALLYPGQALYIRKSIIDVNGYLAQTGMEGQKVVNDLGDYLSSLSISSYHIQQDGSIIPLQVINNQDIIPMDEVEVIGIAKIKRLTPVMVITNFVGNRFNSDLAHTILVSTSIQTILINNILSIMKSKGYGGLNIDIEFIYPNDRDLFNQFVKRLVDALHPQGYSVSIALAVKTSANTGGILSGAQDYNVQGSLNDFVVLMTYDWGWIGGPPFPIAPINEVRRVLNYAVTAIPRSKILMGMPLYGYDWKLPFVAGATIAEMISPQEAVARALKFGARIQYDILYQSPFVLYTDEKGIRHEVWFEDARSVQAKYKTVMEYKLRGVSYWEVGFSFPQNHLVLNDMFEVRKLL